MNSPPVPRLFVNSSGLPDHPKESTLLFAGDFYLRRGHSVQDQRDLFDAVIMELVQQSTFSIVNFEGTIATRESRAIDKEGPHLAIDQRGPSLLKSVGFRGIALANNHAMDYGVEALRNTLHLCADSGLSHVGAGFNSVDASKTLKVLLPGNLRLQVLSFCEREFGVSIGNRPGTAYLVSPQAEVTVGQAKQESDIVVVCAHGGNELMPLPSEQRRQQLRRLIDAGADLVIGHHPHVAQAWELHLGRYIFYSLGDFYFDSTDGRRYGCRDWGFMVRAHLEGRQIRTLEIVPYERTGDKLVAFGGQTDAASRLSYLKQLSSILAGSEFEGYWQQLAVNRLSAYRPFLSGLPSSPGISFRSRLTEALRIGHETWNLLHFTRPLQTSQTDRSRSSFNQRTLGTLNVIRCDSHRWAIETALAVLTGECEDLRSQKIKGDLEAMGPMYGEGIL
jgi:Bacterial capsule synthesis protein PGA_cap